MLNFIVEHDLVPAHTANCTKKLFKYHCVAVFHSATTSPDWNPHSDSMATNSQSFVHLAGVCTPHHVLEEKEKCQSNVVPRLFKKLSQSVAIHSENNYEAFGKGIV